MFDLIFMVLTVLVVVAVVNVVQFIYGLILTFFKRTNRTGLYHLASSIIGIPLISKCCRCKICDGSCRVWECSKFPDNQ